MKIELNTNQKEKYDFNIALAGVDRTDLALFRLYMLFDEFQLSVQGKYSEGIASFEIPILNDFVKGIGSTLPFFIEFTFDEYTSRIYENEFDIVNPPQVEITKLTHVKPVKEEKKVIPIKIDEQIEVKEPSKFAKSFEVFITRGDKRNNDR